MRIILNTFLVLSLWGCSSQPLSPSSPNKDYAIVLIKIEDEVRLNGNRVRAKTEQKGTGYIITLERETYLDCVQHEVKHVFEGNWHNLRPNNEYCDNN